MENYTLTYMYSFVPRFNKCRWNSWNKLWFFLARAIVRIWNILLGLITFFLLNISLKLVKNILLLYPIFTILTSFLTFAIKKLILALMQYPSNYISIKEQGFSFFLVKKSYQNIVFHGIFCIKTFATQKCDSILEPCHKLK